MQKKTKGWSPERRKAQAQRIRQTKPWEKATGPRTAAGKEKSKMNAYKHGLRDETMRKLLKILRLQRDLVKLMVRDVK